jgi:hypothetical protein
MFSPGPSSDFKPDWTWMNEWITKFNYTNLGIIMLGGDLSPCLLSGCEGEAAAEALPRNHGAWIKAMWAAKEANHPRLNASYEVIGVQKRSNNSPELIKKLATWINTATPSNPVVAASLYVVLPPGSSW